MYERNLALSIEAEWSAEGGAGRLAYLGLHFHSFCPSCHGEQTGRGTMVQGDQSLAPTAARVQTEGVVA